MTSRYKMVWIYVPAHRIGPIHLTYISQDAWVRVLSAGCNSDLYISQRQPIDDQHITCCLDPIGAPDLELKTTDSNTFSTGAPEFRFLVDFWILSKISKLTVTYIAAREHNESNLSYFSTFVMQLNKCYSRYSMSPYLRFWLTGDEKFRFFPSYPRFPL